MPTKRNRQKQSRSLQERLQSFAVQAGAAADKLPPGAEQAEMLQKARDADAAAKLEAWLTSSVRKRKMPVHEV